MGFWSRLIGNKKDIKTAEKRMGLIDFLMANFSGKYSAEMNSTYVSLCNTHAKHFSKIKPKVYLKDEPANKHKYLNSILSLRPNELMSASQFWEMVAKDYFMQNLSLIFIEWDYTKLQIPIKRLYPLQIDANQVKVAESDNGDFVVQFLLDGETMYATTDDLIILTRNSDPKYLFGKLDKSIDTVLKVLQTNYEGIEQAIKTSAYLRFIVQSATPLTDDTKKQKAKRFAEDYLGSEATGVAYVDAAQDIIQVNNSQKYVQKEEMEFFEKQLYQYLGGNEKILTATYNEDEWQSYYESTIEPLVIKLQDELNYKLFTPREREEGNHVVIDSNRLQTASLTTRIALADRLLKLPVVVPNVINKLLYVPTSESGDKEYSFLNYVQSKDQTEYQVGYEKIETEKEETKEEEESNNG